MLMYGMHGHFTTASNAADLLTGPEVARDSAYGIEFSLHDGRLCHRSV